MATANRTEAFAQKIIDRAERVANDRQDLLSRAARGVLNIETTLARRVLKKENTSRSLPPQIETLVGQEEVFFEKLGLLKEAFINKYMESASIYSAPEEIPNPNMGGFTSNAITEALRAMGINSRVVYGHQSSGSAISYHYWTEAMLEGIPHTIDATYGQFDRSFDNALLAYPASENPNYGIKEFVKGDIPVYEEFDELTRTALENNNGVLPLGDYLQEEPPAVQEAYANLQNSLVGKA